MHTFTATCELDSYAFVPVFLEVEDGFTLWLVC